MRKSIAFISFGPIDSTLCLRADKFCGHLRDEEWECFHIISGTPSETRERLNTNQSRVFLDLASTGGILDLVQQIRRVRPSFVHFLNPMARAFAIASMLPKRIAVIGDWEDWHTNPENPSHRHWAKRFADRWFIRNADRILCCSSWLRDYFALNYGREDAIYLPYAIDSSCFGKPRPSPFAKPTAVFMGSLHTYWNHRVIFHAAKLLADREKYPDIAIVGDGSDKDWCRAFVQKHQLTNVHMLGRLPDDEMRACLQGAHVLLFPIEDIMLNRSRCPFKVLQYAAARRPVITCRVGEVTSFLGDHATYTDCSPEGFAQKLDVHMSLDSTKTVDYSIEQHSWRARTAQLADALTE